MFNKYFFIATLLFIGGCSSIPEVPNLPFMEPDEVEIEVEAEIDPVAELKVGVTDIYPLIIIAGTLTELRFN